MLEIFKIILIFPVFFLFLIFPINSYNKKNILIDCDIYPLNLLINLNVLFIFSLLPIAIEKYQIFLLLLYLGGLLFKISKNNFNYIFYNKSAILIFFISFLIISFSVASNLKFGWDAKFFYYIKTLFFFEGLNLDKIKNFSDYNWHPHFGSYLWAFFWKMPFVNIEYFGRLFYVFIFCFSLVSIIFSNNKKNYFKIIFFLVTLILIYNYERFSGLQDVLIFSLLIISSKLLYEISHKNLYNFFGLFLVTNLLLWIKSEGLVFTGILLTILALNNKVTLQKKIFVMIYAIVIILFKKVVYIYFDFDTVAQPHYNLDFIFSLNFMDLLNRIGNIIIYISYYGLTNILFFLGILTLFFLNFKNIEKINIKMFNYYFLLNLSFIFCAYIFREMEIVYALRTTMERIVFISSGYYFYLIFLFIDKKIKY